jgi:lipopolysaccharide biosynthesis glycosyltransferase
MTIKALFGEEQSATSNSRSALVFVLNADFLPGLLALFKSMYQHRTLIDLPVIIITEQAEMLNDPRLKRACDLPRAISSEEIAAFSRISAKLVEDRLKLDWIPKYTYLKWLMFDDYGFDQIIFIDADIVCLNPIDELIDLREADLYGSPMFSTKHLIDVGNDPRVTSENVLRFARDPQPASKRLNTGVLVVNKGLLSSGFRKELIEFTSQGEYSVEQAALRTFLRKSGRAFQMISPLYNFKYSFLGHVMAKDWFSLLSEIKLFHFAGVPVRPWDKPHPETLEDHIWAAFA